VLLAAACCSTPATATDATAGRAQLLARIDQFNAAIRQGDKQAYGDVFVDDFVFTWSRDGQIYDRATILPNVVPTPDFAPLVDQELVRIHGDSAVVNYRVRKQPGDAGTRVTFSYARIGGVWKVVASHSTAIVVAEEDGVDTERSGE
jgi:hypothetical protein